MCNIPILIGKCHTCEIWSVSPGTKWKSHFLCGAALCCVESRVSWLEGVLVSTNCAAFYSACVYPSRNCPSICLSHTVVFRDLGKVRIASDFSHKSSSLWLILPRHFGMGMSHRISHCGKAISPLLKKLPMNRSFTSQKQPQYTVIQNALYTPMSVCAFIILIWSAAGLSTVSICWSVFSVNSQRYMHK